jgi:hypothetical protein
MQPLWGTEKLTLTALFIYSKCNNTVPGTAGRPSLNTLGEKEVLLADLKSEITLAVRYIEI